MESVMTIKDGKWDFTMVQMSHPDFEGYNHFGATDEGRIAAFTTKKQATEFAKSHGWAIKNIQPGFSRFFRFYFVGQMVSPNEYRILQIDGNVRTVAVVERQWPKNFISAPG